MIDLVGARSNRTAINTRVLLSAGGATYLHELTGGDGFLSCNEHRMILGCGEHDKIDKLEIVWPSGQRDIWQNMASDRDYFLVEAREPIESKIGR